jgi:hypothetical protein
VSRTCFILGAGFSVPAELPAQETLMLNPPPEVAEIVGKIFNLEPVKDYAKIEKISLEDIFTFLDRIIMNNEAIHGAGIDSFFAYEAKRIILNHIITVFNAKLSLLKEEAVYSHFFNEITGRKINGQANTVITLNWDTIPEYYIYKSYKQRGIKKSGVDYACFDWDYDAVHSGHIPINLEWKAYTAGGKKDLGYVQSILRKAKGYSTIKVLKLHGSINWLYSKALGYLCVKEQKAAYPSGLICQEDERGEMENILITPTLIKKFDNTHLKMIWFNAGIDLSEANRVVFLGYSLAMADFDFRYLLLKSLVRRKDVKIRVLLFPQNPTAERLFKRNQTEERYRNFFSGGDLQFAYMDVKDFIANDGMVWDW